ncbi:MAG: CHC2 zinc finger domain-containing protein, partial [Alphaproteobacteria bacterium]
MATFPPGFLEELKARAPVSEVVGRRVKLTRRGREFVGLSPFNAERTPSFTVNDAKGFYHCFSSGEHGDVFSFLMKTEGLTFPEAVEAIASLAGMEVPKASPEERRRADRAKGLLEAVAAAAHFF